MTNSVSSIGAQRRAMDTMPPNYLSTPGLYSANTTTDKVDISSKPKKKGGFGKALLKTIVTAAVIAGGMVGARKLGWVKKIKNPEKIGEKIKSTIAKAAQYIEIYSKKAYIATKDLAVKLYNKIKKPAATPAQPTA